VSAHPPYTRADFDRDRALLEALLGAWAEREASSFDDAVEGKPAPSGANDEEGSIWDDMPTIDSKRAVGALVELEQVIGQKLPISLIRAGGYDSGADLAGDLLPKVRERCAQPATVATTVGASSSGVVTPVGVQAHP
jgi:hypothetical protein